MAQRRATTRAVICLSICIFGAWRLVLESEAQAHPPLALGVSVFAQAKGLCGGEDDGDVLDVEAAEEHDAVGAQGAGIGGDVGGDDVAVDVGDEDVGGFEAVEGGGVAVDEAYLGMVVDGDVVDGVDVGESVDFDAGDAG